MDTERRHQLRVVERGPSEAHRSEVHSLKSTTPTKDYWKTWADQMRSEISRVHALMDMVNAEVGEMLSDDSMHAIKVLEKNSELRELQAYYKGLRFALDRQKEIANRRLLVTIKLE